MILFVIRDDKLRDVVGTALEQYESSYPYRIVAFAQEAEAILLILGARCLLVWMNCSAVWNES
jgi:hypothetical protein